MNPGIPSKLIGHTCALAVGASLAWWTLSHQGNQGAAETPAIGGVTSSAPTPADVEKGGAEPAVAGENRVDTSRMALRSQAYREAWDALLRKEITGKEREALQIKLLAEWVELDPEAAILAALTELSATGGYGVDSLLSAFSGKIREQPHLFWPMIREKRFGMATAYFKSHWMNIVGRTDPDLLFSYFEDFSAPEKSRAMGSALAGLEDNPERVMGLAKHLATLPDTPENRQMWQTLGNHLARQQSLADLATGFSNAKTPGEEGIYLAGLVRYASWKNTKLGELLGQLDTMPEATASKAALSILRETMNPAAIADITTLMIAKEDWESLLKEVPIRMHRAVPSQESETFLAWAAELPERTETEDLYRCTIRHHINGDPDKARDWIEAMPTGWKRDNALVEYVNSSLNTRKDPAAAEWATERIGSEHFLSTAEEMRKGWDASNKK